MNYISCVDDIIDYARKTIRNNPHLESEDGENLADYLRQRTDALIEEIIDELNNENY